MTLARVPAVLHELGDAQEVLATHTVSPQATQICCYIPIRWYCMQAWNRISKMFPATSNAAQHQASPASMNVRLTPAAAKGYSQSLRLPSRFCIRL